MKKLTGPLGIVLLFAFCLAVPTLWGQNLRASLFEEADIALKQAQDARGELLSPQNFDKGMEAYAKAENEFKNGKNLDKIREKLREAVRFFGNAVQAAQAAEQALSTPLKARLDAEKAGAPDFAKAEWENASQRFESAAKALENGDAKEAEKKGGEAERYFRQAELIAVKANFLDETRALLKEADKQKVEKTAPQTLARSQELLQTAEIELEKNRYDTDYPRSLAKEAKYEAKHAFHLAQTINEFQDKKMTLEDLLLLSEKPLETLAGAIEVVAQFDEGYGKVTEAVLLHIRNMEEANAKLRQDLADRDQQVAMYQAQIEELQKEIAGLNTQLGGIAKEKSELAQRIEEQQRIRERYDQVAQTFTKSEAQVLRTPENEVIIRLIGLNFASGKSEIGTENFELLGKVKKAIKIFPGCTVRIEGHTDSFGGDKLNLELSQKRADAVKTYLQANMEISPERIGAVGYGETKPIANNETKEGRAKNRRIDIILHN